MGTGGSSATGSGGAAGSGQQGGTGGQVDAAPPSRCGFMPDDFGSSVSSTASAEVIWARVEQFLDDASGPPPANLPPQASAALAAQEAMAILDGHFAAGTEARGLVRFLTTWLRVPNLDAGPSAAHTWSMKLLDPNATLTTLLADPTGEPHRIGILTDRQVLAARPPISPRGNWMVDVLFCQGMVPPPPPSLPVSPPPAMGVTHRQWLENSVSPPACKSCHNLMDPPAYSLEHFDATGNYRDIDNGGVVDSSGTIDSLMLSFTSIEDLAPKLATSCAVAQCFAKEVMTDAYGMRSSPTMPAFTADEANHVANAFANSNFSIRALVKAIVQTPSFLQ
jgi:hypothetical protein